MDGTTALDHALIPRTGEEMNYGRIVLATVGGMVAYLVAGFAVFAIAPQMAKEFEKYSAIYRPRDDQMAAMPAGMAAMLIAILVLAVLYAMVYQGGSGAAEGARFGALIGLFVVCAFVMHNYMLLNIGLTLTLMQAASYFIQWTVVGIAIGLLYKPSA
jgi:hypothetical protein